MSVPEIDGFYKKKTLNYYQIFLKVIFSNENIEIIYLLILYSNIICIYLLYKIHSFFDFTLKFYSLLKLYE